MPRRILVRKPFNSKFKVGHNVHVDGDAGGDYKGRVIETHRALTKAVRSHSPEELDTQPGVTVEVWWWDGSEIDYPMEIVAWDSETIRLVKYEALIKRVI